MLPTMVFCCAESEMPGAVLMVWVSIRRADVATTVRRRHGKLSVGAYRTHGSVVT